MSTNNNSTASSGGFVEVNVGGKIYSFLSSVAPQDSLLATMLSDRWRESCARDGRGRIFIDRDGDAFGDVLRYLRSGPDSCGIDIMDIITLRRLRIEADYFGLDDLLGTIDAVRPGIVEVPVLLQACNWSRMTPRRVEVEVEEGEDARSRLEWTQQSGNEAILSHHRTVIKPSFNMSKEDEMIVGESGTYILLLRLHVCLSPSAFGDGYYYPGVTVGTRDAAIADWTDVIYGNTLVSCGAFDYRDPNQRGRILHTTATCAEVVNLLKGDRLRINEGYSTRENVPQPADVPAELLNSLTLVKVHGNALARFERLKQKEKSPVPDDSSGSIDSEPVYSATWSKASHGLPPTPFVPSISEDRHEIIAPRRGRYLILSSTAISWYKHPDAYDCDDGRESSFGAVELLVHEKSRNRVQCIKQFDVARSIRELLYPWYNTHSEGGDTVHAPRYVELNDIVHMETGFELSVVGRGNITIGAEISDCDLRTQNLSMLFLSKSQRQERFTIKTTYGNGLEIAWLPNVSPYETAQPSCFERGLDESGRFDHTLRMQEDQGTFLVLGSLPCLVGPHRELLLLVNDGAVAMSKVIEQFRLVSRTSHNFHEILELKRGDRVSISIFPTEREAYDTPRSLEFGPLKDRLPNFGNNYGFMNFLKLS